MHWLHRQPAQPVLALVLYSDMARLPSCLVCQLQALQCACPADGNTRLWLSSFLW